MSHVICILHKVCSSAKRRSHFQCHTGGKYRSWGWISSTVLTTERVLGAAEITGLRGEQVGMEGAREDSGSAADQVLTPPHSHPTPGQSPYRGQSWGGSSRQSVVDSFP